MGNLALRECPDRQTGRFNNINFVLIFFYLSLSGSHGFEVLRPNVLGEEDPNSETARINIDRLKRIEPSLQAIMNLIPEFH